MLNIQLASENSVLTQYNTRIHCYCSFREAIGKLAVHRDHLRVFNRIELDERARFTVRQECSMEIMTLVLKGVIEVSLDGSDNSVLRSGEGHLISAGDGIAGAVWQVGENFPAPLLQLWFLPEEEGGETGVDVRRNIFG